jgi:hypothetical protein
MTRYARTLIEKLTAVERSGNGAAIHRSRTLRQALYGTVELVERGAIDTNNPIYRGAVRNAERWLTDQARKEYTR